MLELPDQTRPERMRGWFHEGIWLWRIRKQGASPTRALPSSLCLKIASLNSMMRSRLFRGGLHSSGDRLR
jgi:hypothetical protein